MSEPPITKLKAIHYYPSLNKIAVIQKQMVQYKHNCICMIQRLSSFSKAEYVCYLDSLLTFLNSLLDSKAFETL